MRPQSALRSPRLAHPLWSLDPRSAHATNVVRRMPTTAEAPSQQSGQVHERRALAHIARCARCDSTFSDFRVRHHPVLRCIAACPGPSSSRGQASSLPVEQAVLVQRHRPMVTAHHMPMQAAISSSSTPFRLCACTRSPVGTTGNAASWTPTTVAVSPN